MINEETVSNINQNKISQSVTAEEAADIYNHRNEIMSRPSAYMGDYRAYKQEVENSRLQINKYIDYAGLAKTLADNNIYSVVKDYQDELKNKEDILSRKKFEESSVWNRFSKAYDMSNLSIEKGKEYNKLSDAIKEGKERDADLARRNIRMINEELSHFPQNTGDGVASALGQFVSSGKEFSGEILLNIAMAVGSGILAPTTGGASAAVTTTSTARTAALVGKFLKYARPVINGALVYNKSVDLARGSMYEQLSTQYPKMSEDMKNEISLISARYNGAVEALGADLGIGGVTLKTISKAVGTAVAKKVAKEGAKNLAKKSVEKGILSKIKDIMVGSVVGAPSEALEENVQNAIDITTNELVAKGEEVNYGNVLSLSMERLGKTVINIASGKMTPEDEEQLNTFLNVAGASGILNLGIGSVGLGVSSAINRRPSENTILKALKDGEQNSSIAESYMKSKTDSKLNDLSHDAYKENTRILIEQGVAPENVFLDVDTALVLMQQAETDDNLAVKIADLGLEEKIEQAKNGDGKVAIDFEVADEVIFDKENDILYQKIKDDITFDRDSMSRNESASYLKSIIEQMPKVKKSLEEKKGNISKITGILEKTMSKDEAVANATLADLMLSSLAEATGKDEDTIMDELGLKIETESRKSKAKAVSRAMKEEKHIIGKNKIKGVKVKKQKMNLKDVEPNDVLSGEGVKYLPEEGDNVILYEDKTGNKTVVRGNEAVASAHFTEGKTDANVTVVSAKDGYTIDDTIKMAEDIDKDIKKEESLSVEDVAKKLADELGHEVSDFHRKFAKAIKERDFYYLRDILAQGRDLNTKSKKVFSEVTGIKLPKTVKGIEEVLLDYCGKSREEYQQELKKAKDEYEKEFKKRAQEKERNEAIADMKSRYLRYNGKVDTFFNTINKMIEDGAEVKTVNRGISSDLQIEDKHGYYFTVRKKAEKDYFLDKINKIDEQKMREEGLEPISDEELAHLFGKDLTDTKDEKLYQIIKEGSDLADENARLDDIYPEYKGETIDINGEERTVYNSNGDRIAKSAEALRNFYNWFGDSKVVDEQGRPKVMYHGTRQHDISEFKSRYGDKLIFFAYKREFSERWAKNAYQSEEQQEKARKISDEKHDKSREISKRYNKDFGENWTDDEELFNSAQEELKAWQREREEELGIEPIVMDVYLKAEKTFVPSRDWEQVLPELLESNGFTKEDAEVSSPEEIKKAEEEYERKVAELDKKEDEQKVEPDSKEWEENSKEYDRLYQELQAVRNKGKSFQSHLERIKKGAWVYFERESVMKKVRELGYDSIRLKEMSDGEDTTLAVFEGNNQIKSTDNRGTYSTEEDNIYLQAPESTIAGYYDPKQVLIRLTKASNPTTFAHELMHFHFDMMCRAFENGELTEYWSKEFQKLLKSMGAKITDGRIVFESNEARVAANEKLAEQFTSYLSDGKAPSEGLQAIFDLFRDLFMKAYRAIKGLNKKILNKTVESYFDKILVKEDEANALAEQEHYGAIKRPEGITDSQWNNYMALTKKAHSQTVSSAIKGAAKLAEKASSEEYKSVYDRYYKMFKETLEEDPSFVALDAALQMKIDPDSLKGKLPEGVRLGVQYLQKGGLDVETFVNQGGFANVEELVNFFNNNTSSEKTAQKMAHEQAEEWLVTEYPELLEESVTIASRNIATIKAQIQEAMMLRGVPLNRFELNYKNLVVEGEKLFNSKSLSDAINSDKLFRTLDKLSELYRIAELKGDKNEMGVLRWRSAVANYLLMRSFALKSINKRFDRHFLKYKKLTPTKAQLTKIEGKVWDIIHTALYNFKITQRKPASRETISSQITDYLEDRKETFLARDLISGTTNFLENDSKQPKNKMSVADFVTLNGALRLIENVSQRARETQIKERKQNIIKDANTIIEHLDKIGFKKWEDGFIKNLYADFMAMKETLLSKIFPQEVFEKYVLPFMDGLAKKAIWISKKGKELGDIVEPVLKNSQQMFNIDGNSFSYENLLVIMLNSGNEHNRKCMVMTLKNIINKEFSDSDLQSILDQSPKELREIAQKVWDFFEANTKDFKKAQEDIMGAELKMVEPKAVVFSDGTSISGGYYPANKKSLSVTHDFSEESIRNMSESFPMFSFQKERTLVPHGNLNMNLKSLKTWMYQMASMINVAKPYMDLYALINNEELGKRFGDRGIASLREWMSQSIRPDSVNKGIAALDVISSLPILGYRLIKVLIQANGIIPAMKEIGVMPVSLEIMELAKNPENFVMALSKAKTLSTYMEERFSNPEDHLADIRKISFLDTGEVKKGMENFIAVAMIAVTYGDAIASYVTWNAEYKKALAEGRTESEAKLRGDSMVRRLQGDTSAGSRPPLLQGDKRFLTKFASYFIGINSLLTRDVLAGRKMHAVAMLMVAGVIAPTAEVLSSYMLEWMGADDEKKKRWKREGIYSVGDLLKAKVVENVSTTIGSSVMPAFGFGGDIARGITGAKVYPKEVTALTYLQTFAKLPKEIKDVTFSKNPREREKQKEKLFKDVARLFGVNTTSVKENIRIFENLLRR